ncbi:hypothetical protein TSAR_000649 [Trichomalopsis sarcophagae]|uniref:Uncharacterized protein n=1 Tax=Trichomalopsis sarcophagae TaxID=543379 RepID=A0A232EGX3_9HYME|nr:hypothetical protein TSAR_000649 [Trichomalopsis sarcophagae]
MIERIMHNNKMNLRIITHIKIIEAITIEEEGTKITMAIKMDEEVTIASTNRKLSLSRRSWLSSTALVGCETERPPLPDSRYSELTIDDYQLEDSDTDVTSKC